MENIIIVSIIVILTAAALLRAQKHFSGGGCCGGGSNTIRAHKKLTEPIKEKKTILKSNRQIFPSLNLEGGIYYETRLL